MSISEFSFEIDEECSACSFHGADEECEVCGGEIEYKRTVFVPLGLCKEMYRSMRDEEKLIAIADDLLCEVNGFLKHTGVV